MSPVNGNRVALVLSKGFTILQRVVSRIWAAAKFSDVGSVSGLSQFSILPPLSPKILLDSKVVKFDPTIINWLCMSKSVTNFVRNCS